MVHVYETHVNNNSIFTLHSIITEGKFRAYLPFMISVEINNALFLSSFSNSRSHKEEGGAAVGH